MSYSLSLLRTLVISYFDFAVLRWAPIPVLHCLVPVYRTRYFLELFLAYYRISRYLQQEDVDFCLLEYGVGSGGTALIFAAAAKRSKARLTSYYGFDTFKGLPSVDSLEVKRWLPGSWSFSARKVYSRLRVLGIPVSLVECSYGDQRHIDATAQLNPGAYVIHIDCDLFHSTLKALESIAHLLRNGTIVLFDDYYSGLANNVPGEHSALSMFIRNNQTDLRLLPWFAYSANGQAFIVASL